MALANETSNIVVLKTYDIAHLAHLDRAKLADEGIESFIQDENIVSVLPYLSNAVGCIKLSVFEPDIVRARDVLSLNEYSSLDNAFEGKVEAQASCPNCGSTDIIQRNSLLAGILILIAFFVALATPTRHYFCTHCGHKWKAI